MSRFTDSAAGPPFPRDYLDSRVRFRAAATEARLELDAAAWPVPGPRGESLAVDAARAGDAEAPRVLLVSCGLHGIEGYFGAAAVCAALSHVAQALPHGIAVIWLHALNPWGFAACRRVDHENIDPNRNFLLPGEEFRGAPPAYAALDALLNPCKPPSRLDAATFRVTALAAVARRGMAAVKQAVAEGQYDFPRGLFFGGHGPGASQQILARQLPAWLGPAQRVLHLDFHTGLGRSATYRLLVDHPLTEVERACLTRYFGAGKLEHHHSSGTSYEARGGIGPWCRATLGREQFISLCAEFGTYGPFTVLAALRAENQAHQWGEPGSRTVSQAKARLREAFCPQAPAWRNLVVTQAVAIIEQGLAALRELTSAPGPLVT